MFALIGLGNPGIKYKGTRHNIGFDALDYIAEKLELRFSDNHKLVAFVKFHFGNQQLLLVKPKTFMNNSGDAVSYIMARFGLVASQLIVIYDDLDLPAGKIRIRPSGSAGGHKGIASIMSVLNDNNVVRIRVGIGRPESEMNQIGYVLGRFGSEEEQIIREANAKVYGAITKIVEEGIDVAMNLYN
tara:strand:+ start:215 stop:772 length:558 start_codon:yes stop_codon:yes gene_type:complete